MTAPQQALWTRLALFHLDDPAVAFTFTDRLARENGWSKAYASRVVDEYKKFIFLCCLTESGVTPSDAVDQAWHLHLTFTRSYWIDLCRDTLGREIHHNPTEGGKQEAQKFDGFYTDTKQLYRATFGAEPPADIWPGNQTRFADIDFRRVNLRTNAIVPKPSVRAYTVAAIMGAGIVVALLVRTLSRGYINFMLLESSNNVMVFILLVALFLAFVNFWQTKNRTSSRESGGGGCSGGDGGQHHDGSDGVHGDGDGGCSGSGCSGD